MILVCPECSTSYELPAAIPAGGAKVRCTSCSHTWMALPEDLLDDYPAEEETGAEAAANSEPDDEAAIPALSPTDEIFEEIDYSDNQDLVEENAQDDIDSLFADFELEEESADEGELGALFEEATDTGEEPGPSETSIAAEGDDATESGFEAEAADEGGDDNSQDDIDSLFDEPGADDAAMADAELDEGELEAELDALTDADDGEENSQDDIDGLFEDEPVAAGASGAAEVNEVAEAVDPFDSPSIEAEDETPEETAPDAPKRPIWKRVDPKLAAGWGGYALTLILLVVVMLVARGPVVQMAPAMAGIYQLFDIPVNIRGLAFVNVQQSWQVTDGRIELQVEGEIANLTKRYKTMPRLIIGGLSEDRREVFRWVAQVREKPLLPNEKARFSTQMPAPPKSARHLLIRFEH